MITLSGTWIIKPKEDMFSPDQVSGSQVESAHILSHMLVRASKLEAIQMTIVGGTVK